MRPNDRNAGWIKALIITGLLVGNIVVALPHRSGSVSAKRGHGTPPSSLPAHDAVPLDQTPAP